MPNPKNFKPFIDPDGGQWIQITGASKYQGVIWRPVDIEMSEEDDKLKFEMEFLTMEGTQSMYMQDEKFHKLAGDVILDIINETVNQAAPQV